MRKKILITGGAGFIGSKFKSLLAQEDFEILTVGRSENEDFKIDLLNLELKNTIQNFLPDVVCHLASGSNIERAEKEKEKEYRDTVLATTSLMNCLKDTMKQKQVKFIFLSSQSIYGTPEFLPVKETHSTKPVTTYGEYKLQVEELLKKSKLNYTIFRVSSVYGIGQDFRKSGVIAKFINKLMNKKSPVVFNSFDLFSDFIYINDLVNALVSVAKTAKNTTNEIFNLGSGTPTTLKEILNALYKYFPDSPKPELKVNPLYLNERQKGIYLDITKIKSQIDWEPKYSVCDGIKEILSSMKLEERTCMNQ